MVDRLKRDPTLRARGRGARTQTNIARQTDSAAHMVGQLDEQEQLLRYVADRLHDLCGLQAEANRLLGKLAGD
jgi:hypothetical protein